MNQFYDPLRQLLQEKLADAQKIVVLGIGNDLRGDDAVGLLVAKRLRKKLSSKTSKIIPIVGGPAPENATGEVIKHNPSHVILIDAADFGAAPGEIRIIDHGKIANTSFSTHTLPLTTLAGYLHGRTGCEVIVMGIQPKGTEFGAAVSSEVKRAVIDIINCLTSFYRQPKIARREGLL